MVLSNLRLLPKTCTECGSERITSRMSCKHATGNGLQLCLQEYTTYSCTYLKDWESSSSLFAGRLVGGFTSPSLGEPCLPACIYSPGSTCRSLASVQKIC